LTHNRTPSFLDVDWPAAKPVRAVFTTRVGGVSDKPFASFNLGDHVGDLSERVAVNRARLKALIGIQNSPFWLNQVHGNQCIAYQNLATIPVADASFTEASNQPLVVMTADCLPILLTNRQGSWVAACHAGWRGLAGGVIQNTVARYPGRASDLIGWIGPAISQKHFEVGKEVHATFAAQNREYQKFFKANERQRFQFDFIGLAQQILAQAEIECFGGHWCSFDDSEQFYSFRRDGETGRMASLIWIENQTGGKHQL